MLVLGLGTKANLGLTILLLDLSSGTNPYPHLFGFLTATVGVLHGLEVGTRSVLSNTWIIGWSPSSPFDFKNIGELWRQKV